EFNAGTSELTTQYHFTVPVGELDAVLRIESDRMRDILDAQSQWENERGAIEQEVLRDESTPGADFFRKVTAIAYAGTPYGHEGVGTRAAFDRLTGPELKAFYDRWYAPNNAVFVIAGDVDPQRTLAMVRARFEAIPKKAVPPQAAVHLQPLTRTVVRQKTTMIYPLAVVAFRLPGLNDPDFMASFVLQGILGSPRGPLGALVDTGEALSGDWESLPYLPEAQVGVATAALSPGADPMKMTSRLESILRGVAQHGVARELFESTRRRLIAQQEEGRNSIAALAADWSTVIAVDHEPSIAHEQELIGRVTLADVERVAKRYLDPQHAIVGALTPSSEASAATQPGAPQNGPEKPLPPQPPATQLPDWARSLVEHPAVPASNLAPVTATLPNGIRLIVQPETISDSVFLVGNVRTNPALEEPNGKEGIASVLETLFEYGTRRLNRTAFQRAQDELDADISGGASFGLQATSRSFDRAVALLAENELQPRFDEPTFELARRRAVEELETSLSSSSTIANRRTMQLLLPPGDPELREPSPNRMALLTLRDIEQYYEATMRPDLTTIVVVGNVRPEAARAAIERAFRGWHASGERPPLELPPLALNHPGEVKLSLPTGQDVVWFEQTVPIARDAPQSYALFLGNAILGGGSIGPRQSRLFRDLRQNAGLVYSVDSRFAPRRSHYRFTIEFASSPSNTPRIGTMIDAEIARMKSEPVGDFELALAKSAIVRQLVIARGSVRGVGEMFLEEATQGRPLDQDHVDAERLLAPDAHAIQEAFAQYIHPENFVRVIVGP
ncbi:MAG: insulinase family protein, partial [Candidatus Eremiobacteraeota bacterium]|nr:insulinase family protein [Candidatus Eremiobacteraeota bacterium]